MLNIVKKMNLSIPKKRNAYEKESKQKKTIRAQRLSVNYSNHSTISLSYLLKT